MEFSVEDLIRILTSTDSNGGRSFNVTVNFNDGTDSLTTTDPFYGRALKVNVVGGATGIFTSNDGKTITVTNGVITDIV
jgi:hypothetical protein